MLLPEPIFFVTLFLQPTLYFIKVTDYFNQTNKNIDGGGHDKEFMIPFLASCNDAETLENTFKKLTSDKKEVIKVTTLNLAYILCQNQNLRMEKYVLRLEHGIETSPFVRKF